MKISEKELRKVIQETIEESPQYSSLRKGYDNIERSNGRDEDNRRIDFYDIKNAIDMLESVLDRYSMSFRPLHGQEALNYFYDNKRAPSEGQANKCLQYLDYIRNFFIRKERQANSFETTADSMEKDYDEQIMNIARQNGGEGNNCLDILWDLYEKNGEDENAVLRMFPREIQDYIEHENLI